MALSFNADSYQEVSIDWLTVTLKYDNHGGGQANVASPKDHGDEVRDSLLAILSINWTYQDQMKSRRNTK